MIKFTAFYELLFVKNPLESADFYSKLLGLNPVEKSATFALFILKNGIKLGLWSRDTAEPLVTASPGSSEICFSVENVEELYENWSGLQKITIVQKPTEMDFGYTFVALDPDGHRIRIFKPREE